MLRYSGAGCFQDEPYMNMELRFINSLRIKAVGASFVGLLADTDAGKSP
jgi:hypothetical protein